MKGKGGRPRHSEPTTTISTASPTEIAAEPAAAAAPMASAEPATSPPLGAWLADNLRLLRERRGLTQAQVARGAGVPRATYAHLETGAANPTLAVLSRVAAALRVSIEELLTAPRLMGRLIRSHQLEHHRRGGVVVRKLLPDPLPGLDLERMELPPGARMKGVPHTPGCREYLTCESGVVEIAIEGSVWRLEAGDVFVFRGDQRHSYHNPGDVVAVAYSALRI